MRNIVLPEAKNVDWIDHYLRFIETRKDRGLRKHHIVPRSFGGSDSSKNIINLTDREHYIAHLILWRAYRDTKTFWAFHMMLYTKGGNRDRLTSRQYEKVRIEHSNYMKENNPMHQKESIDKMRETRRNRIASGRIKPRKVSYKEKREISERMKKNNPMKNKDVVERMMKTKSERNYGTREHSATFKEMASKRMKGEGNPNFGKVYTPEEKKVMSERLKGIQHPPQSQESLRRGSISKSKYSYTTPYGKELSIKMALEKIKESTGYDMDRQLLISYCKKDSIITFHKGTSYHLYFDEKDRGKTTTECGWSLSKRKSLH